MKLKWYGTAALLVFEKKVGLAFDPFFGIRLGEEENETEMVRHGGASGL